MKLKKLLILFVLPVALLTACNDQNVSTPVSEDQDDSTQQELSYTDITPEEAKKMIDEKADLIVIDVSPHYADGHLPGAINYYLGDGSLDDAIPSLDSDAEYLVYCHVESVSRQGAQALVDAGFKNVYRLMGDYPAWLDVGYLVEK